MVKDIRLLHIHLPPPYTHKSSGSYKPNET